MKSDSDVRNSFQQYGLSFFTESGYQSATKSYDAFKEDIELVDLEGKSVLVTGANSGIGKGTCYYFARRGAIVHLLCRNLERGQEAQAEIQQVTDNPKKIWLHIVDLAEPKQIRNFVKKFSEEGHKLDILINNAAVMLDTRSENSEGIEMHFAINTLSNFLLTILFVPLLRKSIDPRVIIVSSGGMLTEKLCIREKYDRQKGTWTGRTAYDRTKRHQLVLTKKFTTEFPDIKFFAMHPGWTDTPSVAISMPPDFYASIKDILRTIEHGGDTICWLAVTNSLTIADNGEFFRDRQKEIQHFCKSKTCYSSAAVEFFWNWCKESVGMSKDSGEIRKMAKNLFDLLSSEGAIRRRKSFLSSYKNSVTGSEILLALSQILKGKVEEEGLDVFSEATNWGRLLVDSGYIHPVAGSREAPIQGSTTLFQFFTVPSHDELMEMVNDDWTNGILKLLDIEEQGLTWTIQKKFDGPWPAMAYSLAIPGSKLKAVKMVSMTDATVEELVGLLHTELLARHKEWNKSFSMGHVIDYVSPSVSAQYWLYKVAPLEPRDFVVVRRKRKLPNGAVAIFERSIEHGQVIPTKDSIRCDLDFQVRYWRPCEDGGCHFIMANHTDIKGWVPTALANSSNVDISYEETMAIFTAAKNLRDQPNPEDPKVIQMYG